MSRIYVRQCLRPAATIQSTPVFVCESTSCRNAVSLTGFQRFGAEVVLEENDDHSGFQHKNEFLNLRVDSSTVSFPPSIKIDSSATRFEIVPISLPRGGCLHSVSFPLKTLSATTGDSYPWWT